MEGDFIKISRWLLPLSWLYGCGVALRNFAYDMGWLRSRRFPLPVIAVGNITVGGSGKTPHVEYLVRLLHARVRVAVLSRGYRRRSHGFQLAASDTTMPQIGDEPYQMHRKMRDIIVAVDTDRAHGIDRLLEQTDVGCVVLDDAFQHRRVHPGLNILLTDYHRLIVHDALLPAGRLREPCSGKNRADIVIVTKCPDTLRPMDYRVLQRAMALFPYQHLFFTRTEYLPLQPVFAEASSVPVKLGATNVLLLTGIASPKQMEQDLAPRCKSLTPMRFADHHNYTPSDAEAINTAYKMMPRPAAIITTEKDAVRLDHLKQLSPAVRQAMWQLPIHIVFAEDGQEEFNNIVTQYVNANPRR